MVQSIFPPKYKELLDDEIWDFIARTMSHYPTNIGSPTISQKREFYNSMCRSFLVPYPDGVTSEDEKIPSGDYSLPLRHYSCSEGNGKAHIIYYHGGGFILGDLESHDDICAELCSRTGFGLTAVDYRLAPEHLWPCDFEDALASFHYVSKKFDVPIIVCGDSAGANLACAICHSLRLSASRPIGQVLIYPTLGNEFTQGSFIEHSHAPILNLDQVHYYISTHIGEHKEHLQNELCVPLASSDFSNLPPCIAFSAECDPLRDDSRDYCRAITAAGGTATGSAEWIDEPGLVHGYLRARHCSSKASDSFTRIVSSLSSLIC